MVSLDFIIQVKIVEENLTLYPLLCLLRRFEMGLYIKLFRNSKPFLSGN